MIQNTQRRPFFWLLAIVGLMFASACAAKTPASALQDRPTRTLRAFGAQGNGVADDTAAVQQALDHAGSFCLDGEGRTYRVIGTLRAEHDLCFRNAHLRKSVIRFDTRPFIKGQCPDTRDAHVVLACGDTAIGGGNLAKLEDYLNLRTLLVRPEKDGDKISVLLENIHVDKGDDTRSGSRSDAAGIWIDSARRIVLNDVEITGAGKGYGLLIADSENIEISKLSVHDLVWQPYLGDAELTVGGVREKGWNSFSIREFRKAGEQGVATTGFHGFRVREQVTCVMIVRSRHILFRDLQIQRCGAKFDEGFLPWQADGLGVGGPSSDLKVLGDTRIDSTWEGIDLVGGGTGIDGIRIAGATVTNSFGFGVKWGYTLDHAVLEDTTVKDAGIAGVVIYGPVKQANLHNIQISGVGIIQGPHGPWSPWQQSKVGLLIDRGSNPGTEEQVPQDVQVNGLDVDGGANCDRAYLDHGAKHAVVKNTRYRRCKA